MHPALCRFFTAAAVASGSLGFTLAIANPAQANTAVSFLYGIDNNNNIYQVNPLLNQQFIVNPTGLTTFQGSNGIAYDTSRDQLFFFYNPSLQGQNQPYDLLFWNRLSTGPSSLQLVASNAALGAASNIPTNAAYYNNALWYFDGSSTTTTLRKLELTYNPAQNSITGVNLKNYNLNDYAPPNYQAGGYGDIAINTTNGLLYGNNTITGNYFKIDLNQLDITPANTVSVYTSLGTIQTLNSDGTSYANAGLQLSFNADYTKLYGTRFCNLATDCTGYSPTAQAGDGVYFEIADYDTAATRQFGSADYIYFGRPGFRDLGGASAVPIVPPVPGPLPALGAAAALGWARRLRRRQGLAPTAAVPPAVADWR